MAYFAAGPPVWVPVAGMLPGPIERIHAGGQIYVVDERHPDEPLALGSTILGRTVRHAEAVEIWLSARYEANGPSHALPSPAEVAPDPEWLTPDDVAERLGISRDTLDAWVKRAPADLPGSPVQAGTGGRRRHLRWPADRVHEWAQAYQAWSATRRRRR